MGNTFAAAVNESTGSPGRLPAPWSAVACVPYIALPSSGASAMLAAATSGRVGLGELAYGVGAAASGRETSECIATA